MSGGRPLAIRISGTLLRIGAVAALFSLVLEFGFDVGTGDKWLHALNLVVVTIFIGDALVRFLHARDRRAHLRRSWLEVVLVALLLAEWVVIYLVAGSSPLEARTLTRMYIVMVQVYLFARIALAMARANQQLTDSPVRPAWLLVGSYLVLIGIGAALLLMPRCRAEGAEPWSVSDALFTSTSAACVTGLSVRDVGTNLSGRGQVILLLLIQVGGLGLVTFMMFLTYLQQRSLRMRQVALIRDLLSAPLGGRVGRFLATVLGITLGIELVGALVLYGEAPGATFGARAWWSVFHSVSAFCNAGFSLSEHSFTEYGGSVRTCLSLMLLIMLGGIGYPVILELVRFRRGSRLGLHAKLVLATSAILVLGGAALFYIAEPKASFLDALFQSVTARTAGFNTVDIGMLGTPAILLIMFLMSVGASPVSTGGGVKTTSSAVLVLTVRSMLRSRETVEAFGRSIPRGVVNASVAVVVLYGGAVFLCSAALAITQSVALDKILFESVSALSTVGLSTGITAELDGMGRAILGVAMLVGRVGPLAVFWIVMARPTTLRYEYPEETVVVS